MYELWRDLEPYVLGYLISLFLGQVVIQRALQGLWRRLGSLEPSRNGADQSMMLGMVEVFLYVNALLLQHPQFIAFWVGIKTVVKWRHWDADIPAYDTAGEQIGWILGRNAYNLFLLGNALVVAYAVAGYQVIVAAKSGDNIMLFTTILGALIGSAAIWLVLRNIPNRQALGDGDNRLHRNAARAPGG